jgi:hypothetical protein
MAPGQRTIATMARCLNWCMGFWLRIAPGMPPALAGGTPRPTEPVPRPHWRRESGPGRRCLSCAGTVGDARAVRRRRLMIVSFYGAGDSAAWHATWCCSPPDRQCDLPIAGAISRHRKDSQHGDKIEGTVTTESCLHRMRGTIRMTFTVKAAQAAACAPTPVFTVVLVLVAVLRILGVPRPALAHEMIQLPHAPYAIASCPTRLDALAGVGTAPVEPASPAGACCFPGSDIMTPRCRWFWGGIAAFPAVLHLTEVVLGPALTRATVRDVAHHLARGADAALTQRVQMFPLLCAGAARYVSVSRLRRDASERSSAATDPPIYWRPPVHGPSRPVCPPLTAVRRMP